MQLAPQVPLATLTTLRLGGPARELAILDDPAGFPDLAAYAARTGTWPYVIGDGSNLLAADDGYPGLVIRMAATGVRFTRP
jgi:UDP-N-acetylmuramate dehydrogenase